MYDAVHACFQQGVSGLGSYAMAQALRHTQYLALLNHHPVEAGPLHWALGSEPAPFEGQAVPSRPLSQGPARWYRLDWVAQSLTGHASPVHAELVLQGEQPMPCNGLVFQPDSFNSALMHWPQMPKQPEATSWVGLAQRPNVCRIVYRLTVLNTQNALAHMVFELSKADWKQYARLHALTQEPCLLASTQTEIQGLLQQHYAALGAAEMQWPALGLLSRPPSAPAHVYSTLAASTVLGERQMHAELGERAHIEGVKQIAQHLVVHGWVFDPQQTLQRIVLSDNTQQVFLDLTPMLSRMESPDVAQAFNVPSSNLRMAYRFMVGIHISQLQHVNTQALRIHCVHPHDVFSFDCPPLDTLPNTLDGVCTLLAVLGHQALNRQTCEKVLAPVFTAVARELGQQPLPNTCVHWFNSTQAPASVSVIVPLYGNVRFEITQIAALSALRFPGLEVIFAVDDPNIYTEVLSNVERQSAFFGLRCAVVSPGCNLGFSGINNFAVPHATADFVLFLNSDCFLSKAATLFKAISWLQTKRKNKPTGAVGFRLLYPGGQLQHDGMSNDIWQDNPDFIVNQHPRLGDSPNKHPKGTVDPHAALLTAACLLMRKRVFEHVGGFNRTYLRGDFEDSDLCLKLINAGYALGLLQTDSIHHLERQTIQQQPHATRQAITLVNSHLYQHRWHGLIHRGLPKLEVVQ